MSQYALHIRHKWSIPRISSMSIKRYKLFLHGWEQIVTRYSTVLIMYKQFVIRSIKYRRLLTIILKLQIYVTAIVHIAYWSLSSHSASIRYYPHCWYYKFFPEKHRHFPMKIDSSKAQQRAKAKRYKQCSNALTYTSKRYKRYKRYTFQSV